MKSAGSQLKEQEQTLLPASWGVGVSSELRVGVSGGTKEAVGREVGRTGRKMPHFPLPSPGQHSPFPTLRLWVGGVPKGAITQIQGNSRLGMQGRDTGGGQGTALMSGHL